MPALAIPAALDILIVALAAVILIWALRPLFRPILQALGSLPFVGAFIAGRLEVLLTQAVGAAAGWAGAATAPMAQLFHDLLWGWFRYRDSVWQATEALMRASWRIIAHHLPALEGRVVGYAQQLYNLAIAWTNELYSRAIGYAQQLYNLAVAWTNELYARAVAYAGQLYVQAVQFAQQVYAQAIAYAGQLYGQAVGFAQALYGQAIGFAQVLYQQAVGFAELLYRTSVGYADQLYRQGIGYTGQVGLQAERYADALYRLAVGYAAASSAAVLARVINLERSKCQKFCEPLGDLGNLIQQVEDAGLALGLLALSVEAFHDPRGTARAVDGLIGGTVRDLIQVIPREEGIRTAR